MDERALCDTGTFFCDILLQIMANSMILAPFLSDSFQIHQRKHACHHRDYITSRKWPLPTSENIQITRRFINLRHTVESMHGTILGIDSIYKFIFKDYSKSATLIRLVYE